MTTSNIFSIFCKVKWVDDILDLQNKCKLRSLKLELTKTWSEINYWKPSQIFKLQIFEFAYLCNNFLKINLTLRSIIVYIFIQSHWCTVNFCWQYTILLEKKCHQDGKEKSAFFISDVCIEILLNIFMIFFLADSWS